ATWVCSAVRLKSYSITPPCARGDPARAVQNARHMSAASARPRARRSALPRDFYTRADVLAIGRQLLGQRLVVPAPDGTRVAGTIVETEAYRGPRDRASHAYGGRRTRRTATVDRIRGTPAV